MGETKLDLILAKDDRGEFRLWACRGTGRGCKRNLTREKRKPCGDCMGPLEESLTLGDVARRLAKGDA